MSIQSSTHLRVLQIDASARQTESISRRLSNHLLNSLSTEHGTISITHRDLANDPLPYVNEDWVNANFTAPEQRTEQQRASLAMSDTLVQELMDADLLLIGLPLYNFGIPAALKAWVDMVARARLTFRYTAAGPEGLLKNKRAYLLIASGGVKAGSEIDFATSYMRHVLGFLGITEVTIIAADQIMQRGDDALKQAFAQIDGLFAQPAHMEQRTALQA